MAVNLLLVGRNGNGKSSTGNSILGKKVFNPKSSSQSCEDAILKESSFIDNKVISVVDGPGLSDDEDVKLTLQNFEKALNLCPEGFNAVITVLKYGIRFTKQEKDAIILIKDILGQNVLKDYGIIILTYGDSFSIDMEEENMSFETWCRMQTGDIVELFNECGHRYVLFNNRAKDEWSFRIQRDSLIAIVEKLQASPYTLKDYKQDETGRKKILVLSKLSLLEDESKKVQGEINYGMREVDVYGNPEWSISKLAELQRKLDDHRRYLQAEADGTDVVNNILGQVAILDQNLKIKMTTAHRMQQLRRQEPDSFSLPNENTHIVAGENQSSQAVGLCQRLRAIGTWICQRLRAIGTWIWQRLRAIGK